jgi:hypothetical protein
MALPSVLVEASFGSTSPHVQINLSVCQEVIDVFLQFGQKTL